jgi:hypothetical protein
MAGRKRRKGITADDVANTTTGWMLGHEVAHGHDGFPGDPLPDGHLGSPANLAFWGGVMDGDLDADDPDDPDAPGFSD